MYRRIRGIKGVNRHYLSIFVFKMSHNGVGVLLLLIDVHLLLSAASTAQHHDDFISFASTFAILKHAWH